MRKPSSTSLIFAGLALGIVLGGVLPEDAHPLAYDAMAFLAKAFIGLIKGLIVPLLFATIVVGIAQTGDLKAVGRMGGKALLYFEAVTSLALVIGLVVVNTLRPGDHLPLDLGVHAAVPVPHPQSGWDIALHALPTNLVKHAAEGDILPVVVFATLFGVALTRTGERGKPVLAFFEGVAQTMFKYTDIVMRITPLGVFGAMDTTSATWPRACRSRPTAWSQGMGRGAAPFAAVCGSRRQPLLRAGAALRARIPAGAAPHADAGRRVREGRARPGAHRLLDGE